MTKQHILLEDELFRYQLVTEKYVENTLSVANNTIFTEGVFCKSLGCPNDPQAMLEMKAFALSLINDGISVIAIDKKTDKVVGMVLNKILVLNFSLHDFNIIVVKNQPFYEDFIKSCKSIKARQTFKVAHNNFFQINLFDALQTDCLMKIVVLGVLPEYRGKCIAKQICKLSVEIGQKLYDGINIKHSVSGSTLDLEPKPVGVGVLFSSFISQKIGRYLNLTIAAQQFNEMWEVLQSDAANKNIAAKTITLEYLKFK